MSSGTTGVSGDISLHAGSSTTPTTQHDTLNGGNVDILAGALTGAGVAGGVSLIAGAGLSPDAIGGDTLIAGGAATVRAAAAPATATGSAQ